MKKLAYLGNMILLLLFSFIFYNSSSSAETVDKVDGGKWNVYELSLFECIYNHPNIGFSNPSFVLNDSDSFKPNIKGAVGAGDTYLMSNGKVRIKCTVSGSTCTLTVLNYGGSGETLDLTLPDTFDFYFVHNKEALKDGEGKLTGESRYDVACTHDVYLTSISTTFRSANYVNNSTNNFLNLTVPNRVTTLDSSAFEANTKLKSVDFEGAIQTMGSSVFANCNNLIHLDLTDLYTAMNTIPSRSFYMCSQLENISIPDTILNIGNEAFYQCDKVDYLILTDKIKSIGSKAFAMCSNLRYIYITSNYQNWNTIVDTTEVNKIVTSKLITVTKDMNKLDASDSGIFGGEYYIHSGVDIKEVTVKVGGNEVAVEKYKNPISKVYGYKFNAVDKGTYDITAEDEAGNTLSLSLKYTTSIDDRTKPVVKYNSKSLSASVKYFNKKASITIVDTGVGIKTVKVNKKTYKCSNKKSYSVKVTKDGSYTVIATDASGNVSKVKFYVDTKKPVIKGIKSGKTYKNLISGSWSDSGSGIKSLTIDGVVTDVSTKSQSFSSDGKHTIIITDKAGNKIKVTFKIKRV